MSPVTTSVLYATLVLADLFSHGKYLELEERQVFSVLTLETRGNFNTKRILFFGMNELFLNKPWGLAWSFLHALSLDVHPQYILQITFVSSNIYCQGLPYNLNWQKIYQNQKTAYIYPKYRKSARIFPHGSWIATKLPLWILVSTIQNWKDSQRKVRAIGTPLCTPLPTTSPRGAAPI